MNKDRVRDVIGEKVARLRKKAGYRSQGDFAERVGGIHRSMISQIENGRRGIPFDRIDDFATALGVEPSELDPSALGESSRDGYVSSVEDLERWRDQVIMDKAIPWEIQLIITSLTTPEFLDRDQWIATVTIDQFIRETGRSRELVDQFWHEALESDYIETIGEVEWVLRPKFP